MADNINTNILLVFRFLDDIELSTSGQFYDILHVIPFQVRLYPFNSLLYI
jgi:hypothetical protein